MTSVLGDISRMMRLIAAWAVMSGALLAQASAADMAVKATPAPVYNWTGWYAGVNAGYGWHNHRATFSGDGDAGAGTVFTDKLARDSRQAMTADSPHHAVYRQSLRMSGFAGGGQLGYNWQVDRNWLVGVEADLQYSGIKGDAVFNGPDEGGVTTGATSSHSLEWFGTLRGRVGLLLGDRFLAFGTGGLAYGATKAQAAIAIIGSMGWDISTGGGFATSIVCPGTTTCLAGAHRTHPSAGRPAAGLNMQSCPT